MYIPDQVPGRGRSNPNKLTLALSKDAPACSAHFLPHPPQPLRLPLVMSSASPKKYMYELSSKLAEPQQQTWPRSLSLDLPVKLLKVSLHLFLHPLLLLAILGVAFGPQNSSMSSNRKASMTSATSTTASAMASGNFLPIIVLNVEWI